MEVREFRWRTRLLAAGIVSVCAAACTSLSEPLDPLLWEGQLVPRAGATVLLTGNVAMVANQNSTEIGIGITAGEPLAPLSWIVRSGTCSESGTAIAGQGVFPAFVLDEDGNGNAHVLLGRRVENREAYAVELFAGSQASGAVQACGVLLRRN